MVKDRGVWLDAVHGVAKNWIRLGSEQQQQSSGHVRAQHAGLLGHPDMGPAPSRKRVGVERGKM